ncbi:capsular exopolysaccharide synthesis family protein [Paenarthrobacter nicotinovorans]|uniref:Polysaccharide biosynthesis tyrosine autokinase n=1 Tax=Paenarthrobacter nicotinovorans TaxID=29320 RepID=A0ABV0GU72_PAENI|nr:MULTISPECIES: polysaccharide biosynthesis tyrosine autokinase [Micrococcaceae]MDR6435308.1 capsular exopolysaccharide synthesis family protein [Paenarthrobacter nicotinovorans]BCW59996.1 chromosome partitioning protein [Arthrobacter sp. StoSoilB20]SCZ49426.1 capsular exopolysaccharide family [Arthrobacter sp. UNCCL28]
MELTDYWKVLRAHWISVIAITVLGGIVAFGWTLTQTKVFSADASGIISVGVNKDLGTAMAGESYSKSRAKSYLDVAKSRSVAETVIQDLKLQGTSPEQLISRISAQNPQDTATLKFSAQASSPEGARDLAEAWVRGVAKQVAELEKGSNSSETSIVSFRSLDAAQLPTTPTSPNTRLALMIGVVAGLLLAIGYALLRNIFDRRVRSAVQLEAETGVAVIGTVPFHNNFDGVNRLVMSRGGNDLENKNHQDYAVAEAIRELRTNLQFMDVDEPPRIIVVTSALPGEGKTTVVANLAQTIAASGQRVVVVDGDLRRPTVAKTFGLLTNVGLTDVLIGRATLNDVLQPWGESGDLFVLGAGSVPPNPSELLGSNVMRTLLEDIAKHAIVLVDAPPLLPVTDAAILTARTDGALVVSRAGKTTYDQLKRALQNLERVKGRPLGLIINGVSRKSSKGEDYGYQYYTYYNRKDTGEEAAKANHVPAAESTPVAATEQVQLTDQRRGRRRESTNAL